jgi:hypothetical protein
MKTRNSFTPLYNTLLNLADDFAHGVLRAVRTTTLGELLGDEARAHSLPSTHRRRSPSEKDREGFVERAVQDRIDRLVDLVAQHPRGARSEVLRGAMDLSPAAFRRVAAAAVAAGKIIRTGERRETTFSVAKQQRGSAGNARGTRSDPNHAVYEREPVNAAAEAMAGLDAEEDH